MNPYRALQLQMQLEGLTLDADGLLTTPPAAEEAGPLVLFAHLATGDTMLYLHASLPETTRIALAQWHTTAGFADRHVLRETLMGIKVHSLKN